MNGAEEVTLGQGEPVTVLRFTIKIPFSNGGHPERFHLQHSARNYQLVHFEYRRADSYVVL